MNQKKYLKLDMRNKILKNIAQDLTQAVQWIATSPENYVKYLTRAEAFIEFLEIEDCGSVGGFDKTNPLQRMTNHKIVDRFLTLLHKRGVSSTEFFRHYEDWEHARYKNMIQLFTQLSQRE